MDESRRRVVLRAIFIVALVVMLISALIDPVPMQWFTFGIFALIYAYYELVVWRTGSREVAPKKGHTAIRVVFLLSLTMLLVGAVLNADPFWWTIFFAFVIFYLYFELMWARSTSDTEAS